jgi:hypothetical protein
MKDNNAFVFSLDNKKKYNILKPEYAVYFGLNDWWGFGYKYNAIVVFDNSQPYVSNGAYDIKEQYELNGGENYFDLESFEIYQVIY